MIKATRNHFAVAALVAALALTSALASSTAPAPAPAQQQEPPPAAKCATATVRLNKATPKAGDELIATVGVQSCATAKERVAIQYSYTDPCGNVVEMGTSPVRLAPGEKQDATINFLAPAAAECPGDFTMTAALVADGAELNRASTPFKVSAQ